MTLRTTKASGAEPLYMYRPVFNAEHLHDWARSQGFTSALEPDDMHVTVVFSRTPFSAFYTMLARHEDTVHGDNVVIRGGKRTVEPLGDKGAVVLKIESGHLEAEHEMFRSEGASWDFPSYMPHITITYRGGYMDPTNIEPFMGDIVLGPLCAKLLNTDWDTEIVETDLTKRRCESLDVVSIQQGLPKDTNLSIMRSTMEHDVVKSATILKSDDESRMVYGWASVSTVKGELVVDTQGDTLAPDEMVKMADRFMASVRTAKAMHAGEGIGEVLHSMPLTADIAKAFGIESDREGWMIAMKIHDDKIWSMIKAGTLGSLSIGGRAGVREAVDG